MDSENMTWQRQRTAKAQAVKSLDIAGHVPALHLQLVIVQQVDLGAACQSAFSDKHVHAVQALVACAIFGADCEGPDHMPLPSTCASEGMGSNSQASTRSSGVLHIYACVQTHNCASAPCSSATHEEPGAGGHEY